MVDVAAWSSQNYTTDGSSRDSVLEEMGMWLIICTKYTLEFIVVFKVNITFNSKYFIQASKTFEYRKWTLYSTAETILRSLYYCTKSYLVKLREINKRKHSYFNQLNMTQKQQRDAIASITQKYYNVTMHVLKHLILCGCLTWHYLTLS